MSSTAAPAITTAPSKARVYLRLGRVSNLPTVWSNVIAGAFLAGARPSAASLAAIAGAMSLFYTGGMFLNDAFDRDIDACERPERPIPAGLASAGEVFAIGFGLLAAGEVGLGLHGLSEGRGPAALLGGLVLAAAIVLYDAWHKRNPLGPLLMGLCRVLVYITAAAATATAWRAPVIGGALVLLVYLVTLTWLAKRGSRYTAELIAGISLLDSVLVTGVGAPMTAALAALGFPATLVLQRWVRGT